MGMGGYYQHGNNRSNVQMPITDGSSDPTYYNSLYKEKEATSKIGGWKNDSDMMPYRHLTYYVTFRVKRELEAGQSLCVLGSIPDLGNWKEFKHHMKRTDGNTWESISPLVTHSYYFQYKYSLLINNGTE